MERKTRKFRKDEIIELFLSTNNIFTIGSNDRESFDTFQNNVIDLIHSLNDPIVTVDESYNTVESIQEYNETCRLLVYSFPFCCVVPVDHDTRLFVCESDRFDYCLSPVPLLENSEWNRTLPHTKFCKLVERLQNEIGTNRIESCVTGNEKAFHLIRNENTGEYSSVEHLCLWCNESIDNPNSAVEHNGRLYCSNYCKQRSIEIENTYQRIVETTKRFNELTAAGNQSDADKLRNNGIYSCCIDEGLHINPTVLNDLYRVCGPSATFENILFEGRCLCCGKPLPPTKNRGSKYCCNRCRSNAWIKRKKENKD